MNGSNQHSIRSLRDYIQSEVTAFYVDEGGRYVVVPDHFLLDLEDQYEAQRATLAKIADLSEGRRGRDISEIHRLATHPLASSPASTPDDSKDGSQQSVRPEVEALANFALTVEYGRPILDLCDWISQLEEQIESLKAEVDGMARAPYGEYQKMRERAERAEEQLEGVQAQLAEARQGWAQEHDEFERERQELQEQYGAQRATLAKIADLSEGRRGRDISEIHRLATHPLASSPASEPKA